VLRRGLLGLGTGVLAGLLFGAVARLMMRLVTLAAGHSGDFSVGGTLSIMLAFVVFMAPGALLAALWRGRGRWLLLAAGTAFLLVVATGIAFSDIGDVSGLATARWALLLVTTAGVYAAILATPVAIFRVVRRVAPGRTSRRGVPAETTVSRGTRSGIS
jgi:hypothetical protein